MIPLKGGGGVTSLITKPSSAFALCTWIRVSEEKDVLRLYNFFTLWYTFKKKYVSSIVFTFYKMPCEKVVEMQNKKLKAANLLPRSEKQPIFAISGCAHSPRGM